MDDELRVPKRRVAAEALLPDGVARRVTLFLAENASGHAGPERPSDLLNGGDEFVPAFDEEAGAMTFLNRDAVEAIRVPGPPADADAEELTLATEHDVEVTLGGGATLRGLVSYLPAPDHRRLVDFLNEPEPFFRLVEEGGVALVNKRRVVRIALRKS